MQAMATQTMTALTVEPLEAEIARSRQLLELAESLPAGSAEQKSAEAELAESLNAVLDAIWWIITTSYRWWYGGMRLSSLWSLKEAFRHAAQKSLITLSECEMWLVRCDLFEEAKSQELNYREIPGMLADAEKIAKQLKAELLEDPVFYRD